jgi:hypothetical protein
MVAISLGVVATGMLSIMEQEASLGELYSGSLCICSVARNKPRISYYRLKAKEDRNVKIVRGKCEVRLGPEEMN